MKNYTKALLMIPKIRFLLVFLGTFIILAGCKKDEESTPTFSQVMFIHAIPDVGPMDLFIDESSASSNIGFGSATEYHEVPAGNHRITATLTASINEKVNTSHAFDGDKKFSVVAFNTNAQPQSIVIPDTVATPASGKFWVRYINLSPASNNASYVIRVDGSTALFEFGTRSYKTVSNYREYDAGAYTFNAVNINAATSSNAATTGEISFEGGKIYTLVLTGTESGTAPLNLQLAAVANK